MRLAPWRGGVNRLYTAHPEEITKAIKKAIAENPTASKRTIADVAVLTSGKYIAVSVPQLTAHIRSALSVQQRNELNIQEPRKQARRA